MIHVHYTMTNDCMCVGSWEEVLIVEPNLEVWLIVAFAPDEIQARYFMLLLAYLRERTQHGGKAPLRNCRNNCTIYNTITVEQTQTILFLDIFPLTLPRFHVLHLIVNFIHKCRPFLQFIARLEEIRTL